MTRKHERSRYREDRQRFEAFLEERMVDILAVMTGIRPVLGDPLPEYPEAPVQSQTAETPIDLFDGRTKPRVGCWPRRGGHR